MKIKQILKALVDKKYLKEAEAFQKVVTLAANKYSFELDTATEVFIKKYKLEKDVEKQEGNTAVLTPEAIKEVEHAYSVFVKNSATTIIKRENEFERSLQQEIEKMVKRINKDFKVDIRQKEALDSYYYVADLLYKNDKSTIELEGYYYHEEGYTIGEAAQDWNWAAWLGIDASPFYDSDFVDGYLHDARLQWFGEATDIKYSEKKIKDEANRMLGIKAVTADTIKHVTGDDNLHLILRTDNDKLGQYWEVMIQDFERGDTYELKLLEKYTYRNEAEAVKKFEELEMKTGDAIITSDAEAPRLSISFREKILKLFKNTKKEEAIKLLFSNEPKLEEIFLALLK